MNCSKCGAPVSSEFDYPDGCPECRRKAGQPPLAHTPRNEAAICEWQRANRPEVERRQRNALAPFMPQKTPSFIALSADDAATQALTPAIEWAKEYGRMTAIAEALTEATGASVSRQMVGRWLNPDAKKRMLPNLGTGLMLLHVVNVLSAPDPMAANAASWGQVLVNLQRKPAPKNRTRK